MHMGHSYEISLIDKSLAKKLIIANHYSHKWTSCRYALGLFNKSKLVGVAIYGFPVGRQVIHSISPLLHNEDVLELTRLWVNDSEGKNTESMFLGKTFSWLKNNSKVKVLISYSDPMYGHLGTIYQATNWLYQGNSTMLVKGYLHELNGEILHPRTCVAKYGTVKKETLLEIDPLYKRIELMKKHRYIMIIDRRNYKKIFNSLKHPVIPYPKDNLNCKWVTK